MLEIEQHIEIMEFDENWSKKMAQFTFEPHTHDKSELLIITEGEIEHFIDFENTIVYAPSISFINQGKSHRISFRENAKGKYAKGWLIKFDSSILNNSKFIIYANYYEYSNISIESKKSLNRLIAILELLKDEALCDNKNSELTFSFLDLLLKHIELERIKDIDSHPRSSLPHNITLKNFLRIVENNFRRDESVDFYANKLNTNARSLNQICQHILQKSVTEIIEIRKLLEAKNLLIKTDKTIAEIAYTLGYNDNAYFSNVFKKRNGQTPSEFRNKMQQLFS